MYKGKLRREVAEAMEDLVQAGEVEILVREDGEFVFELTDKGKKEWLRRKFNSFFKEGWK